MLKLSTLLSKLDFSTMGDLRADLVGEAERLEGVEEVRKVISRECEKADGPSIYFGGNEIGCEIEWAILGTAGYVWLCPHGHPERHFTWREECARAKRFATKSDAQSYITRHDVDAAIPFPLPKIKEAE